MSKYDILIIGSGLGGLECGAVLSKEGYNVCVVEKNKQFGGCFQTYQRKGRLLDTGIHYIGSLDEGEIINQYFRYFGIMDKLNIRRLDEGAFDQVFYKDNCYDYAMGHDRFVETLAQSFPDQRQNLKKYVDLLQDVGNLISVDNLKKGILAVEGMKYFCTSAAECIAEVITNPDLQQILAGSSLLYGGVKDKSTFYHHAMVNNSYFEGAYRFVDGSMQVSLELINVIRANGGTVLNDHEVTRIIVGDERVKGVEINHEEIIECSNVISNVHPKRTLELLDKNRSVKNIYTSRINSLENTYGIFTIYLLMKKNHYPYINRNYYLHGHNNVWYDKASCMGKTTNCMISMQASSHNPDYADVVTILTPMYMEELTTWKDTSPENRGQDYLQFKKDKTEQVMAFIRRHGIDFDDAIENVFTTSPLSYRDYTGSADGSAYGVIKNYKCPQIGFISTRTKLPNLFFTGQNLNVHGALGVTLTAMLTCADFVGQEYLARKVGNV